MKKVFFLLVLLLSITSCMADNIAVDVDDGNTIEIVQADITATQALAVVVINQTASVAFIKGDTPLYTSYQANENFVPLASLERTKQPDIKSNSRKVQHKNTTQVSGNHIKPPDIC